MKSLAIISVFIGLSIFFSCNNKKHTDLETQFKIDAFEAEYSQERGIIKQGYFGAVKITYEVVDGKNYFEGDILIPDKLIYANIYDLMKQNKVLSKWDNNTIPYVIDATLSKTDTRVYAAINHWNSNTDLKFIERTVETDYIEFTFSADGCSSNLGKQGGRQFIRLSNDCKKGNVKHEIGHAVGLMHEHSKPTRNNNLMVHWNRFKTDRAHNYRTEFQKLNPFKIRKGEIDFNSIMMYSCYGFSRSPNFPTLTKADGISTWPLNRSVLSKKDIEVVNLWY